MLHCLSQPKQTVMEDGYFFGYGSLVNRATHAHAPAFPATITGWRRIWRHLPERDLATLSVVKDPATQIDGLIAGVKAADWPALDAREFCYERCDVTPAVTHQAQVNGTIQMYEVTAQEQQDTQHAILLSYLDVVVQGYLQVYGEDGVAAFFATTSGWDAPILNDRVAPRYPRHQVLSDAEQSLVDAHLHDLAAQVKQAH